jgi:hypothetical protein
MSNAATYRRNITKSRAGLYRLTLIDKETGIRVTDEYGWNNAAQARAKGESRLAEKLAENVKA